MSSSKTDIEVAVIGLGRGGVAGRGRRQVLGVRGGKVGLAGESGAVAEFRGATGLGLGVDELLPAVATVGVPADPTVLPSLLPVSLVRGDRAEVHQACVGDRRERCFFHLDV